jgi:hypothetical protein
VKLYVAGLYLPQKSSDAVAIINADAPKRIVMHFLHGASKKQMSEHSTSRSATICADAKKTMQADIERMLGALEPVKEGDQLVFT